MSFLNSAAKKAMAAAMWVALVATGASASAQGITCWFVPGSDGQKSKTITEALSKGSGLAVTPRVATSYADIFKALAEKKDAVVYAGSFASAMLSSRGFITPLVQKLDGQELYSGVLIYPKGGDPAAILRTSAADISFALGASSGESSAKAATGGKASIGVKDHMAAVNALKAGKAKGAVVKNFWWENNKAKFPEFQMYSIPGVSDKKNPDNVLSASASTSEDIRAKLTKAALASKDAFGATSMVKFDTTRLKPTLELMTKGGINPKTYAW